ncbi:MAG: isoleucine--tRNA ligase [Candidatus Omnitrophica bacterium]|nr:isoleucine--tRNA ligase [Candidatus Omnitrophota bacterium]
MDYKKTLNLPKTAFPMKADLPKKELLFLQGWAAQDMYALRGKQSAGREKYILHDGPPYANGHIHIGHALNKTLKDIVVKFKSMQGFDAAYVPGWDCHGLPIEHQLFKELKISKYQVSQQEFRRKASEYAAGFVALQKEEFKRLGIFGDWDNPYLTFHPEYEAHILYSLSSLVKGGYIYRGLKPVNWCFKCETALAEAEVEYEDHTSPSIFVLFPLLENEDFPKGAGLLIWTTTPWTLLANVAVAVHPDFIYCVVKADKAVLVIARVLVPKVMEAAGIRDYEIIREIKGSTLEGASYTHPLGLRKGRVVLAEYVSADEGTGLVHTAPGHGNDDYLTGTKYKLNIIMPVDAKGNFDESTQEFKGMNVYDANKVIIEKLGSRGVLLFASCLQHSYPHCWRCKNPVIFRATSQWFLNLAHNDLRARTMKSIMTEVQWIPEAGRERIKAMVELRPDWCLSRQRYWGVPIPALICTHCKEEFLNPEVIDAFAHIAAREGTDAWFIRKIEDFTRGNIRCPSCQGTLFSRGADILDVWFDSGVSHQAVLKDRKELDFPCALYLEGSDQHRGWFQSSLITSIGIEKIAPFKRVLTHGFVVDGEGRKMSKSLGNVISPQDIIKDYGADILRLWCASSDYNEDIRISGHIIARLVEAYRKIRNTARFILSNLYDFDPVDTTEARVGLKKIDQWVLSELNGLIQDVTRAYEGFSFYKAYKAIYDFCNEELSMYYLDMVKGRLYTYAASSPERRAVQAVLYEVLHVLVRLIAPVLVFTSEEIWQHMPKTASEKETPSVHLLDWPVEQEKASFQSMAQSLEVIFGLIPEVAKVLEEKRSGGLIGSSFEAQLIILTNDQNRYNYLERLQGDLEEIFKVSQVVRKKEDSFGTAVPSLKYPDIALRVQSAEGQKCARCWNYSVVLGKEAQYPDLCPRCVDAINKEMETC